MLVLAAIEAKFKAPARLSDMLYVTATVDETRGARMRFTQHVHRHEADGEVIVEGTAEVACMDARGGRPRRFPLALIQELTA